MEHFKWWVEYNTPAGKTYNSGMLYSKEVAKAYAERRRRDGYENVSVNCK